MNQAEHREQVALFQWAALAAGTKPELGLLYAIPNGGARNPVTGAQLKAEGVKAGMPDVHLPVPRGPWASLYLEIKAEKGTLKPHQRELCERLARAGNRVAVCWGWEAAQRTILDYLSHQKPMIENSRGIEP
jgi:hypothetical protein